MIQLNPQPGQQQQQLDKLVLNNNSSGDSSSDSSYLSYCSDDEGDDYDMVIALKQKANLIHKQKAIIKQESISTSQFESSTQHKSKSQQYVKHNNKNINKSKQHSKIKSSPNSDPSSNINIKHKNKNNHHQHHQQQQYQLFLHQDTLDLNEILKILDQAENNQQLQITTIIQPTIYQKMNQNNKNNKDNNIITKQSQQLSLNIPKQKPLNNNHYNNKYIPSSTRQQYLQPQLGRRTVPNHNHSNNNRRQQYLPYQQRSTKLYHHQTPTNQYNNMFYPHKQNIPINPHYYQHHNNNKNICSNNKRGNQQFASSNYMFWGVLISIKLASFMSVTKNVLIVPFSNTQFTDSVSKIVQTKIKYNLKQIAIKQSKKCNQKQLPNGHVFSVKAKGLQSNYRGIYFIKSPQNTKQSLKYFDVNLMKKSIEKIFQLLNSHNEEHVVFPEFQWGSFSQGQLSELLISGIFREINQNKKSQRCQSLKEVIICVSNCETFELYSKYLRFYVRQMIG